MRHYGTLPRVDTPEEPLYLARMAGPKRRRTGLVIGVAAGAAVALVAATVAVTLAVTDSQTHAPAAQQRSEPAAAPTTPAGAPATTAATTAAAAAVLKMGSKADGLQVAATAHAWKQPAASKAPPPEQDGFEWGAADVEICPKIEGHVVRENWRLTYADHTTIEPSSVGYQQFPEPNYPWDERDVSAGQCIRGWVTYPVPIGKRPATIQYQSSSFRTDWQVS